MHFVLHAHKIMENNIVSNVIMDFLIMEYVRLHARLINLHNLVYAGHVLLIVENVLVHTLHNVQVVIMAQRF